MKRSKVSVLALVGLLSTAGAAGALVHHGWSEYDSKRTMNLTGTVGNIRFGNPHVLVTLRTGGSGGKAWEAVLGPPSRMQARGLPQDSLRDGLRATVVGYPHKSKSSEMRAERIIIGSDTTELR